MKKVLIPITIIIAFIIGVIIENQYDIIHINREKSATQPEESMKWSDEFSVVEIKSPIDGHMQKAYFYKSKSMKPQPLVLSLHTWSFSYTQFDSINVFCLEEDYNYIHPNFRGVNNHKDACCSELVISDIDAAIDYALKNANVDSSKIFVTGTSGGGFATLAMFMKSRHTIKKFSSWVPLVDLVQWYEETTIRKLKYADEILACTESVDGVINKEIAKQKSPIFWETPVDKLKNSRLEIYTGVYDGMLGHGVIPITHSINFYNKVLQDLNENDSGNYVSDVEKLALLEFRKPLGEYNPIGGREVCLVKESNNIRLTLFNGGHEMLERFAFENLVK